MNCKLHWNIFPIWLIYPACLNPTLHPKQTLSKLTKRPHYSLTTQINGRIRQWAFSHIQSSCPEETGDLDWAVEGCWWTLIKKPRNVPYLNDIVLKMSWCTVVPPPHLRYMCLVDYSDFNCTAPCYGVCVFPNLSEKYSEEVEGPEIRIHAKCICPKVLLCINCILLWKTLYLSLFMWLKC